MSDANALERARVALAAATRSPAGPTKTHYLAAARVAADLAAEELRELRWAIEALERGLVQANGPPQQELVNDATKGS